MVLLLYSNGVFGASNYEDKVKVDGIYYRIDTLAKEAVVSCEMISENGRKADYSGDIFIRKFPLTYVI